MRMGVVWLEWQHFFLQRKWWQGPGMQTLLNAQLLQGRKTLENLATLQLLAVCQRSIAILHKTVRSIIVHCVCQVIYLFLVFGIPFWLFVLAPMVETVLSDLALNFITYCHYCYSRHLTGTHNVKLNGGQCFVFFDCIILRGFNGMAYTTRKNNCARCCF